MEALLGSKEIFRANLQRFLNDPRLGMLGSCYLLTSKYPDIPEVRAGVEKAMHALGVSPPEKLTFIAGSIFMVRSCVLRRIRDTYNICDFEMVQKGTRDGTLAHVLERVFGCYTIARGYKLQGVGRSLAFELHQLLMKLARFIYQRKITSNNHLIVKLFKMPIIYFRRS